MNSDRLYQSPFTGKTVGCKLLRINKNLPDGMNISPEDCNIRVLTAMHKGNVMSLVDMEILDALYHYGYLNSELIRLYIDKLSSKVPDSMKKSDYDKNLRRLRCYGFILLYASDTGSNFYVLSKNSRVYMSNQHGKKYYPDKTGIAFAPPVRMVRRVLAGNQFAFRILSEYGNAIARFEYRRKLPDSKMVMESLVTLRMGTNPLRLRKITLMCIVVRVSTKAVDVRKKTEKVLSMMDTYDYPHPQLLFICEDDAHVIRVCQSLFADYMLAENLGRMYFITDEHTSAEGMLSNMYSCSYDTVNDEYIRRVVALNIRATEDEV